MKTVFFSLLAGVCFFTQAQNEVPILMKSNTDIMLLGKQIYFYEDLKADLTFADIQKPEYQQRFKKHDKDVYTHQASRTAVWFKIVLQNLTGEDVWLDAGGHSVWYINFYRPEVHSGIYRDSVLTGGLRPDENKAYPVNFYWLRLADKDDRETKVFYLRMATGLHQEYPIQAGTLLALTKNKEGYDYLTAAFVGLMLIMTLYNLFLASATNDRIYLVYVGYLISLTLTITFANNYPLFTGNFWLEYFLAWVIVFQFFTALFTDWYLEMRVNAPRLRLVMWAFMALLLLQPILLAVGVHPVDLSTFFQLVMGPFYLTLLSAGVYLWWRGFRNAWFYLLGWSFAEISVFVFFFALNGVLPYNMFTRNAIYFGSGMEVLMFSLALANRLNTMRNEKEQVQAEKLLLIEEQNQTLEQKVIERTAEVHHRVKNNLQIIASLINLKTRQNLSFETNEALQQLNGRIFSMGLIHEKLYKNENFKVIRLDEYLSEISRYLVSTFAEVEHPITLKLDCQPLEVDVDKALACGLIINELVTNSAKYAFTSDQQYREISVSLNKSADSITFQISDNGALNNELPENFTKSFGSRFVGQLVSTKLQGEWRVNVENGFRVSIRF